MRSAQTQRIVVCIILGKWWRHQMETISAILVICAGSPTQRPVTRGFDVYFDLRLNKRLCKQSWGWWLETLLCPLWRHSNEKEQPQQANSSMTSLLIAILAWSVTSIMWVINPLRQYPRGSKTRIIALMDYRFTNTYISWHITFNAIAPIDVIWRHRTWSVLVFT